MELESKKSDNNLNFVSHGIVEHDAHIIKYALTKGIQFYEKCKINLRNFTLTTPCGKVFVEDDYVLTGLDGAKEMANIMRLRKINQLEKQIEKLRNLDFYEH